MRELLVELIPNFPNWHHENFMADGKENSYQILGVEGL